MFPDDANDPTVDALLLSYRMNGGVNLEGPNMLPSRDAVAAVAKDVLALFFPGYFGEGPIDPDRLPTETAHRLRVLRSRLLQQIERAVHGTGLDGEHVLRVFEGSLPSIRELLMSDVAAAFEGDPAARSEDEVILAYPGIVAVAIQRVAHALHAAGVPLVPRMLTEWAHGATGIDIHPGAAIGASFFIDHGTGVVIGETCVIGAHVKIYQGVTLGAKSFPKDSDGHAVKGLKRHPNVRDRVTIYAGATLLGDIEIGAGSTIGSNVWLLESVPPGSSIRSPDAAPTVRTPIVK
ncbi:MAG: hypothetical protein RIS21_1347 [Planctomycetota bacterium]